MEDIFIRRKDAKQMIKLYRQTKALWDIESESFWCADNKELLWHNIDKHMWLPLNTARDTINLLVNKFASRKIQSDAGFVTHSYFQMVNHFFFLLPIIHILTKSNDDHQKENFSFVDALESYFQLHVEAKVRFYETGEVLSYSKSSSPIPSTSRHLPSHINSKNFQITKPCSLSAIPQPFPYFTKKNWPPLGPPSRRTSFQDVYFKYGNPYFSPPPEFKNAEYEDQVICASEYNEEPQNETNNIGKYSKQPSDENNTVEEAQPIDSDEDDGADDSDDSDDKGGSSKYSSFGKSLANQLLDLEPIEAAEAMAELQSLISKFLIKSIKKRQSKGSASSLKKFKFNST